MNNINEKDSEKENKKENEKLYSINELGELITYIYQEARKEYINFFRRIENCSDFLKNVNQYELSIFSKHLNEKEEKIARKEHEIATYMFGDVDELGLSLNYDFLHENFIFKSEQEIVEHFKALEKQNLFVEEIGKYVDFDNNLLSSEKNEKPIIEFFKENVLDNGEGMWKNFGNNDVVKIKNKNNRMKVC